MIAPHWQLHGALTHTHTHACAAQSVLTRGYGAVMDSGTTFNYLPTALFDAFRAAVDKAVAGKGLRKGTGPDPSVGGAVFEDVEGLCVLHVCCMCAAI